MLVRRVGHNSTLVATPDDEKCACLPALPPALQGIYVHTARNVLISISPKIRLPRTFARFCGLMVQLLQKLSIRATNGPDKLMKASAAGCPAPWLLARCPCFAPGGVHQCQPKFHRTACVCFAASHMEGASATNSCARGWLPCHAPLAVSHCCFSRTAAPAWLTHQVIKGPVTKYFPLACKRIGFSQHSSTLRPLHEYVKSLDDSTPMVFVVGAFAHGKVDMTYVDEEIAISEYPLSAAYCLARITNAVEQKWNIV